MKCFYPKASLLNALFLLTALVSLAQQFLPQHAGNSLMLPKLANTKPLNLIFIITDDHRFDGLGFLHAQSFIKTPNLDKLAREGAYLPKAFVTTSLCTPSRASVLTGLYTHNHKVVGNEDPAPASLVFFPQYLQQAGYHTALIGKWHIDGSHDDPQRGFDYWVSFKELGSYLPSDDGLNVNGKKVAQKGYITDELTDYALRFLQTRPKEKPFMLYLSHIGPHLPMIPAARHKGMFKDSAFKPPYTMMTGTHTDAPMWVKNRRNSRHGVDFAFQSKTEVGDYYRSYGETLYGIDESIGRLMDYLTKQHLLESTLIIFMGDNGVHFGDHGFVDKRTAYEESMRVPMLAYCPALIKPGTVVQEMVANIDVAATFLEAAGLQAPAHMNGQSFLPLLQDHKIPWRKSLLYEYYWERNFPYTPTLHALRTDRYKYVHCYGIWDMDELYDLESDPGESRNLIRSKEHEGIVQQMNTELYAQLQQTGGAAIPLAPDKGYQIIERYEHGSPAADFPSYLKVSKTKEK